jgi:multiple sugar transport system ATP-binding protein
MVYVTHDQVEAMTLADRIVVLAHGRIEQAGTPIELYERPDNLFVASFIGSPKMNLIPVEIAEVGPAGARLVLPGGNGFDALADASRASVGERATLGLRPEHIHIVEGANGLDARVRFVEDLGALTYGYFEVEGVEGTVTVQSPGHQRLRAGEQVRLTADPAAAYLFDAEGKAFPRLQAPERDDRRAVSL